MSVYFPKSKSFGGNVKVELNLLIMQQKEILKNALSFDTSKSPKKVDLANLKSEVDKLDIDNLEKIPTGLNSLKSKIDKLDIGKSETTPVVLSKLSNVVKNYVDKKTEYYELVKNVNDIQTTDTSHLVTIN